MFTPDWYVDPVDGNDTTGDGLTFATAFKTTSKAISVADNDDVVALCATGIEYPAATLDFNDADGAAKSLDCILVGYNATGTLPLALGDYYTLNGRDMVSGSIVSNRTQTNGLVNLRITNGPSHGLRTSHTTGEFRVYNCRIDENTGSGYETAAIVNAQSVFLYTLILNNSGYGIIHSINGRGSLIFLHGQVIGNTGSGILVSAIGAVAIGYNVIANNGGTGFKNWESINGTQHSAIFNNTFYGNGGHGLDLKTFGGGNQVYNNLICNNGTGETGFGIQTNAGEYGPDKNVLSNNHFHGNAQGEMDVATWGFLNQNGDPLLVDAAALDFRPSVNSPLISAGIGGVAIGALSPSVVSSGAFKFMSNRFG